MNILFMAHSGLRWLILLAAAIAIIKYAIGWLGRGQFKSMDRGLMAGFSGLMDLQSTLGILVLIWTGFTGAGYPRYRIEHGLIMTLASILAHLSVRWRNASDSIRFRNNLILIVGSIVLVVIGIAVLPGGLSR